MALIVAAVNQSNIAPVSDYKVEVLVGDGGPNSLLLWRGEVRGHVRAAGWKNLLAMILEATEVPDVRE